MSGQLRQDSLGMLSEQGAEAAIGAACKSLFLCSAAKVAASMAAEAARQRLSHQAYLAEVLTHEYDERGGRARARRIKEAKFPRPKRLVDLDPDQFPDLPPAKFTQLASGAWIDAEESMVLLGDSGTGKTHLLIGLGTAAAEQGRRVRYTSTAALVNELIEAADAKTLSRLVGKYARLDLLCPDEVGYIDLDPSGADLLFEIITAREERASIACASNVPFSEWARPSPTPGSPQPSWTGSLSVGTSSTPVRSRTD